MCLVITVCVSSKVTVQVCKVFCVIFPAQSIKSIKRVIYMNNVTTHSSNCSNTMYLRVIEHVGVCACKCLMCGLSFHARSCVHVGIMNGFAIICQHTSSLLFFFSSIMWALNYVYKSTVGKYHCTYFH